MASRVTPLHPSARGDAAQTGRIGGQVRLDLQSRPRRNRKAEWARRMVRENVLTTADLIWPLFVVEGTGVRIEVASMPGVQRLSVDGIVAEAERAFALGIPALALFPFTERDLRDPSGSEALNPENLVCRACRAIKAAVPLPVIAAGGIMDGRGIAAMLQLGADAVQMGTAFLLAEEATISAPWRAELAGKTADDVRLTRAFSGRYARGIENRFMREMREGEIPPYPIQNALTQELRAASAKAGRSDMLSLWAGQGVHALRAGRTADLVATFWAETQAALRDTAARYAP